MSKKSTIKKLVNTLDEQKHAFLSDIETSIIAHVGTKSTGDCLTLVSHSQNGETTVWYPSEGMPYVERFIAFVRGREFDGKSIDSILTSEITGLVSRKFDQFYKNNKVLISEKFSVELLRNRRVRGALLNALGNLKPLRYVSTSINDQVFDLVFSSVKDRLYDTSEIVATKIAVGTSVAVGTAVSIPIVKSLITKLSYLLASKLQILLAKLIAIPAVKKIVLLIVKKFVLVTVLGGFVKLVVAKTGLSVGAVFSIVLVPIIVGILVHEWAVFPEKLGKEVAKGIRSELGDNFIETNFSILSELFDAAVNTVAEDLNKWIQNDPEIEDEVSRLVSVIEA